MTTTPEPKLQAVLLVALVAAMPVAAGCLGTAQATAKEEYPTAQEEAAERWDDQAELAGIQGLEGSGWPAMAFSGRGAYTEASYWDRAANDDEVGDGHSEIWRYLFISPNKPAQAYVVVVDKDGEVVHQEQVEREGDHRPVGTWTVDSDEAMEIAREANPGLREGTDREHFGVMMALAREDGRDTATWFVAGGGGDASGGGGGFVLVDAVTGEVLQSSGGFSNNPYGG